MPQSDHVVAQLRGASLAYGDAPVFADLDLDLAPGELLAVVGPSGAGKSTLLGVLAGLQTLTSGTIRRPEDDGGSTRVVFQQPSLLPWRTVAENVRLGLEFRANARERGADADASVHALLAQLGIAALADRRPAELSGGQAQRVAIARALAAHPTLLLLDEPFSALDPIARADAQEWVRNVHARSGLTTVLVTHDLEEALVLADRVGVLSASGWTVVDARDIDRTNVREREHSAELAKLFAASGIDPDAPAASTGATVVSSRRGATRRELIALAGASALLALPVAAAAAGGAGRASASAAGPVTAATASTAPEVLRIGYLPITDAAPLLLAHDYGEFAARGIETPSPTLFRGWAPLVEALQGGSVDIVHLLMPLAVQLRYGAGVPVKVLAWNHVNGSALTVGPDIAGVSDLAGRTVAIPAWFSIHNVVLQKVFTASGLTPVIAAEPGATEVQLVVLPPADMPAALANGSIAGYIVAEPFCAAAEVQGIGRILRFTGDVWRDHACCVTVVREDFLDRSPDLAARATEAIVAAQAGILADRDRAARRLSEGGYLPQPLPAIRKTLVSHDQEPYVASGAVQHPGWKSERIDFQPYAYPSFTDELVRAMKQTRVDADTTWLATLDPTTVHADLVSVDVNRAAVEHGGGLAAFSATTDRVEEVLP